MRVGSTTESLIKRLLLQQTVRNNIVSRSGSTRYFSLLNSVVQHHHVVTTAAAATTTTTQHRQLSRRKKTTKTIKRHLITSNGHNTKTPSPSPSSPGLFSIPSLHKPSDFITLSQNAIRTCDDLRSQLTNTTTTTSNNNNNPSATLRSFDSLSNTICSVIDAAELCRSVHSSPEWRHAAQRSFELLSGYISDLNSDEGLYHSLCRITSRPDIMTTLTEEERRMATLLRNEFERDGIHLDAEKKREAMRVQGHIVTLESLFSSNIIEKTKYFDLPAKDVRQILPGHIIDGIKSSSSSSGVDNDGMVTVSSEAHITNTLLKYSPNPPLRKEVYMESYTSCPENLQVLDKLIQQRRSLSHILGFSCHAERFLRDKMVQNQSNVFAFLSRLSSKLAPLVEKELELLRHAKKQIEGNSSNDDPLLQPWDVPFYTALWKAHKHSIDPSDLAPYFSVENCIRGMIYLCDTLFQIKMTSVALTDNERWCDGNTRGIHKFTFCHEEVGDLGVLYLDLHPRMDKYSHAAHFTVRCGCKTNNNDDDDDCDDYYQLPIVALVCNLSSPPLDDNAATPSLLSHPEVETLFHEFGHALHSLLSRTTFQHVSGTRTAVDYVEVPSHLFEHFIWDETFLKILGRHYRTGCEMPDDMIRNLVNSRTSFQHLECQMQVVYALLDQQLFGVLPQQQSSSSSNDDTTQLLARLHRERNIPYADGTFWHARFGHLVTYGAGYYSYLYSQVLASDVWKERFKNDPLNREAGHLIWHGMLRYGGAKDPVDILRGVLGREPRVEVLI